LSYLLDKSQTNLEAAQLLHQFNKYAAVPHCAYYSCLQRIKYELCVHYHIYCDDNSSELRGKSSHQALWNTFHEQIAASDIWGTNDIRDIKSCLDFLKSRRLRADYFHLGLCTEKDSMDSLIFAIQFRSIINRKTNYE
jgi:hypothetical protein